MSKPRLAIILLGVVLLAVIAGGTVLLINPEPSASPAPAQITQDPSRPLENVLDAALAAYNSHDSTKFLALFARNARPAPTFQNYEAVFQDLYRRDFGKYKSKKILSLESMPTPDYGQLVYEGKFEKRSHVKISANYIREGEALKLMQLRFEKM
jgi:hypothetical protein